MRQEGDASAFLRCRSLGDLTSGAKRDAHTRKMPCKPRGLGQICIGFVEADQGCFHAAFDLVKVSRARVEAKPERRKALGDYVTIFWTSQTHGNIRLAPFEANHAEAGRDVDIKAGMLPRQSCKPWHKNPL